MALLSLLYQYRDGLISSILDFKERWSGVHNEEFRFVETKMWQSSKAIVLLDRIFQFNKLILISLSLVITPSSFFSVLFAMNPYFSN